jgi:hypothetical protein
VKTGNLWHNGRHIIHRDPTTYIQEMQDPPKVNKIMVNILMPKCPWYVEVSHSLGYFSYVIHELIRLHTCSIMFYVHLDMICRKLHAHLARGKGFNCIKKCLILVVCVKLEGGIRKPQGQS